MRLHPDRIAGSFDNVTCVDPNSMIPYGVDDAGMPLVEPPPLGLTQGYAVHCPFGVR